MSHKHTSAINRQTILGNTDCFRIMSSFWNVFDKNIRSRVSVQAVIDLFASVCFFTRLSENKETVSDFVFEQLYLLNLSQNQEQFHKCRDKPTMMALTQAKEEPGIRRISQQKENVELRESFSEIDFLEFFNLAINFELAVVLNHSALSFCVFWEYLFVNVIIVRNSSGVQMETNSNAVDLVEVKEDVSENNWMCLFVHERVAIDRSLIYEGESLLGLSKSVAPSRPHVKLGGLTRRALCEYAQSGSSSVKNGFGALKNQLVQRVPIFVFFVVANGSHAVYLSPSVFDKYLFEEVCLQGSPNSVWKDVLCPLEFLAIDHLRRFNSLNELSHDPYYLSSLAKSNFETERHNLSEHLMEGLHFAQLHLMDIVCKPRVEDCEGNSLFLDNRAAGAEKTVTERLFEIDRIEDVRTQNPVCNRLLTASRSRPLRILVIGKQFTRKSRVARVLAKALNADCLNVDDIVVEEVERIEAYSASLQSRRQSEMSEEESAALELEAEEHKLDLDDLTNLRNGDQLSRGFIARVIARRQEALKAASRGFVVEFSSVLFGQDLVKSLLREDDPRLAIEYVVHLKVDNHEFGTRAAGQRVFCSSTEEGRRLEHLSLGDVREAQLGAERAEFLKGEGLSDDKRLLLESLDAELRESLENGEAYRKKGEGHGFRLSLEEAQARATDCQAFEDFDCTHLLDFVIRKSPEYFAIEAEGATTRTILKSILKKLEFRRCEVPVDIVGSPVEGLLDGGRALESFEVRRQWSFFKLVDCVEFCRRNSIRVGLPEFAVEFQNCVFVFCSEDNKAEFSKDPLSFLTRVPRLKGQANVLISCPDHSAAKEAALRLSASYGFELVDLGDYLLAKLRQIEESKEQAFQNLHGLFENANVLWADVFKGAYLNEPVAQVDLLKLFLLEKGVPFEAKFDEEDELKALQEKADKNRKKPPNRPPRNLPLSSIVPNAANVALMNSFYERIRSSEQPEEVLKRLPTDPIVPKPILPLKGWLFYNLHIDVEVSELLASVGLELDKAVWLGEDQKGNGVVVEEQPDSLSMARALEGLREEGEFLQSVLGEEGHLRLDCRDASAASFVGRVADFIDPFKDKIDSDQLRCNFNFETGSDSAMLPFGVFGQTCPVLLLDHQWFRTCKPQEHSLQINGRLFCFSDETRMEAFRTNYQGYLDRLSSIDMREYLQSNAIVFAMGSIGSGLRSLTARVSTETGLAVFDLKAYLIREKTVFMRDKVLHSLIRSGFKAEESEEQVRLIEGCRSGSPEVLEKYVPEDPEEEQQAEEQLLLKALQAAKRCIVLLDLHFSETERLVFKNDLKDLLMKFGLLPSVLVVFKAGEFEAHRRVFDPVALRLKLEGQLKAVQARNAEAIARHEQMVSRVEALEDGGQTEEKEPVGEVALEPEINLEEEVERVNVAIQDRRRAQDERIADFLESTAGAVGQTVRVSTETPVDKIVAKVVVSLREAWAFQLNHFKASGLCEVNDSADNDELTAEVKIERMVDSRAYSLSEYGFRNCLNPKRLVSNFDNATVFNDRIYFFETPLERQQLVKQPELLGKKWPVRQRHVRPRLFFLQRVLDHQFMVRLRKEFSLELVSLEKAVKHFFGQKSEFSLGELDCQDFGCLFRDIKPKDLLTADTVDVSAVDLSGSRLAEIRRHLWTGLPLSDQQKVYLIRLYHGVVGKTAGGVVFEEFPENVNQFVLMAQHGLFPTLVFTADTREEDFRKSFRNDCFHSHPEMMSQMVYKPSEERRQLEQFIAANYGCLFTLSRTKSTESNLEIAKNLVDCHLDSLTQAVVRFGCNEGFGLGLVPFSKWFIEGCLTGLGRLSVTDWVARRQSQVQRFSRDHLFFLKGSVLAENKPDKLKRSIAVGKPLKALATPVLAEVATDQLPQKDNQLKLFPESPFEQSCPVCHADRKPARGLWHLSLFYRDRPYFFCSLLHLHNFFTHPVVYSSQRPDPELLQKSVHKPVVLVKERRVIDEVTSAMNHICKLKLKFPGLSLKETALRLLSLFLKYRNTFKEEAYRRKYEIRLNRFISDCQEVDRIASEVDRNKNDLKRVDMNLLKAKIDNFIIKRKSIETEGDDNYLGSYFN